MKDNIKDLLNTLTQLDINPKQSVVESEEANPLLKEWQQFKEQTVAPKAPINVRPNPQITQAMNRLAKTVPGMPPAARVSTSLSAAAAAQETGQPLSPQVKKDIIGAQLAAGQAVLGAAGTPGGGPIIPALSNVQRQSQVAAARTAQGAQKAAQQQGIIQQEDRVPFAGEVAGQKPGDQVRGTETARGSRHKHPFQGRLVGTSESKK